MADGFRDGPPLVGPPALTARRALRLGAGLAGAACLVWLAGFAWFMVGATMPAPPVEDADGIVVLTGGAGRVETALHLLADGHARLLLVSGAGPGTSLVEFARLARLDPSSLEARVTLGRMATSTVGNAGETARWARDNGLRSLLVVTAGYHMPRALLELGRALPGVLLHPYPVLPPALRKRTTLGTLRLLVEEYSKLIAAWLTPYAPEPAAAPA